MNKRQRIAVTTVGLMALSVSSALTGTAGATTQAAAQGVEQTPLTDGSGKPAKTTGTPRTDAQNSTTLSTGKLTGKKFSTLGLSWKKESHVDSKTKAMARLHKNGKWGAWKQIPLELDESVNAEAKRAGSPAFFAGDSDGVELTVTSPSRTFPQDLKLAMVSPGKTPPVAQSKRAKRSLVAPRSLSADTRQPSIGSRADWGADESRADPGYKTQATLKAAVIHHTVTGNNAYSQSEVPKIINGIYIHHIENLGYGDFPYHFIVDRFGGIWEGRKGSVEMKPDSDIPGIVGGHAQGFNTNTFGVAALGNFEPNNSEGGEDTGPNPEPTPAMKQSLTDLLAWKLGQYGLDAQGKTELTSAGGGGTNPHPRGTKVNVDVITSHRDVNATACPGQKMYDFLPELRRNTAAAMRGAPAPVPGPAPSVTPTDHPTTPKATPTKSGEHATPAPSKAPDSPSTSSSPSSSSSPAHAPTGDDITPSAAVSSPGGFLALTGAASNPWVLGGAGLLVAVGGGALMATRRRRAHTE